MLLAELCCFRVQSWEEEHVTILGKLPLLSDKTTLKLQINGETLSVGCLSVFGCGMCTVGKLFIFFSLWCVHFLYATYLPLVVVCARFERFSTCLFTSAPL